MAEGRRHCLPIYSTLPVTIECVVWAARHLLSAGGLETKLQHHIDSGHVLPLDPDCEHKCDACLKAFMRDKPAFQFSKSDNEEAKLETMNGDLLDLGEEDCNGDRYNINCVMLRTRLGKSKGLPNKTSAGVMKAICRFKSDIETKTDPGDKEQ